MSAKKPFELRKIEYLTELMPGLSRHAAYRIARAHPEWVVRVGRNLYVHVQKLEAFIDAGGDVSDGQLMQEDRDRDEN